jgi:hypothetical protein
MQKAIKLYCSIRGNEYISHIIDIESSEIRLIRISYYVTDGSGSCDGEETDMYFISFNEMNNFLMQLKYVHDDFIEAWFMFYNNVEIKH